MSIGCFYLHEDGSLIYKPGTDNIADIRESTFARGLWIVDTEDRASGWCVLVEGLAAGADQKRVAELAEKWSCTDEDGQIYADRIGVRLSRDGDHWMATRRDFENLQESPAGFGITVLQALSELAKALKFQPSKMWGAGLADLARVPRTAA